MKCHVPGQNVKVLGRTIHALARYGDELYLESLEDCIILRTLNAAESAYAMVKFNKKFFSYFNYNYYSTEDNEGLKCKISMKSALTIFKSPNHMDKEVENLEIKLDPESCKLIFQLRCKHGIMKTHYVSILDCKAVNVTYATDSVPNRITSHHRILMEALSNFQTSDDHITVEATEKCLLLRNYLDATTDYKLIRSQINLKPTEFDNYSIQEETCITFTLKEFRALLVLAEALNLSIQINFETTGRPAVFILHNSSTYEAHFVLSTTKADNETQSTYQTTESKKRKANTTINNNSSVKKKHLDVDIDCLNEDTHLFNFIDVPDEVLLNEVNNSDKNKVNNNIVPNGMEVDHIPASPTSRNIIKAVFKRCFEKTFDPRTLQPVVLAENSDSK